MNGSPVRPATRIVSLVPSVTESLFCLGLGDRIVGITDWCVHPSDRVSGLPRVGGTKNPSVRQILELEPDLVIANREENPKRAVVELRTAGVDVWVTYPRTVLDSVTLLRELAELGAATEAVRRLRAFNAQYDKALAACTPRRAELRALRGVMRSNPTDVHP